jgi:hypothetical protein
LPTNNRLGWKGLPDPYVNVTKLFTVVIYECANNLECSSLASLYRIGR